MPYFNSTRHYYLDLKNDRLFKKKCFIVKFRMSNYVQLLQERNIMRQAWLMKYFPTFTEYFDKTFMFNSIRGVVVSL